MIYAKRTDANQCEIMDALRKAGYDPIDMHSMGRGFPDLLVPSKSGIWVVLEVKTMAGRLTKREAEWFARYKAPKEIVRSVESALDIMQFWDGMRLE